MDALNALLESLKGRMGGLEANQRRQVVKEAFDDFAWDTFRASLADSLVAGDTATKWPTDPTMPPKTAEDLPPEGSS